jgi:hypothetical protein
MAGWAWLSVALLLLSACGRTSTAKSASRDGSPSQAGDAEVASIPDGPSEGPAGHDVLVESAGRADISPADAAEDGGADARDASEAGEAGAGEVDVNREVSSLDAAVDVVAGEASGSLDALALDGAVDAIPVTIPSRQSVHIVVVSQQLGWVISYGKLCAPFTIERQTAQGTWESIRLGLSFQCGCECPAPGGTHADGLTSFAAGPEFTWDAREQIVYTATLACDPRGPYPPIQMLREAGWQPVASGHYRVSVGIFDALPSVCSLGADESGQARCNYPYDTGGNPSVYQLCPADRAASAEFDLPPSGDITVYVLP